MNKVIAWLLDSDPALRWQVMRDLLDAPQQDYARERARIPYQGWGKELLDLQREDGSWAGKAWNPGFDSTMHVLMLLSLLGLDPQCAEARAALKKVADHVTWRGSGPEEYDDNSYFMGEEEACINGQVASGGAYFRQDVRGLIERLLNDQLADGGWNCRAPRYSLRSSFNSTICVLEALLAFEQHVGADNRVQQARIKGEEFLLERRLHRSLRSGEAIRLDNDSGLPWTYFSYPPWWRHNLLRTLDYFRAAGVRDERLGEALDMVEAKRTADGRWLLDVVMPGREPLDMGEREGHPSRWITFTALRVLRWFGRAIA